jgi:hypothetical protein
MDAGIGWNAPPQRHLRGLLIGKPSKVNKALQGF